MELNKIYSENCISNNINEGLNRIPSKSVQMINCDLPYGTTQNKWDAIIPFNKLWNQYERIIKDNGVIVLTAKQPFTSMLVMSNKELFKYSMVWRKNLKTGNLNARKMPMGAYEDVLIFYKNQPIYNPQQIPRTYQVPSGLIYNSKTTNYGKLREEYVDRQSEWLMPDDVIDYEDGYSLDALELENEMLYIKCIHNSSDKLHPTQKPVELYEWLIKTYTNEGDLVVDNCCGSGTTAIACINTNRFYICFDNGTCDKEGKNYGRKWADIAQERVDNHIGNSLKINTTIKVTKTNDENTNTENILGNKSHEDVYDIL